MLRPLLVANFDRVVGGGEVGLLMLADGLHARGHRPLLTPRQSTMRSPDGPT